MSYQSNSVEKCKLSFSRLEKSQEGEQETLLSYLPTDQIETLFHQANIKHKTESFCRKHYIWGMDERKFLESK